MKLQACKNDFGERSGVSPMAVTLLSVVFRSAKETLLLRSKRRLCSSTFAKVSAIGREPSGTSIQIDCCTGKLTHAARPIFEAIIINLRPGRSDSPMISLTGLLNLWLSR